MTPTKPSREDSFLAYVPSAVRVEVAQQAAFVIRLAHRIGADRWGVTPFEQFFRVNVGWTEILTASSEGFRLIVGGESETEGELPPSVFVDPGKDPRGYYPSVPGSVLVFVPYKPVAQMRRALKQLQPALEASIRSAARRPAAQRSVVAGHRQLVVEELAAIAGSSLPTPSYAEMVPPPASSRDPRPAPVVGTTAAEDEGGALMEGALSRVLRSRHERNAAARAQCIAHHGTRCKVCDLSFGEKYGPLGEGLIHVHHLTPLGKQRGARRVDPVTELVPVCPNCHAMLHREDPPLGVERLREAMAGAPRGSRR
ncbi:MAG: hypothetical protein NW201_09265 [Gemmatimonadales bacterium]|nr:hypothetical protein [Gemmatimonadales bacterium]